MYKSKKIIQNKALLSLKGDLYQFLIDNQKIYCSALKRPVFLSKLPDVILRRKSTVKKRLECFIVAIDILRHDKVCKQNSSNKQEFALLGSDCNGVLVEIHLREESSDKDKKLFFVSCFQKKKTSTH